MMRRAMSVPSAFARAGAELLSLAALALFVIGLALALFGCASPLDAAVRSLNGSQVFLVNASDGLADLHRRERDEAIAEASTAETARAAAAEIHRRYRAAWDAYAATRTAWIGAAAATQAAIAVEAAGGKPDLALMLRLLLALSSSLGTFAPALPAGAAR